MPLTRLLTALLCIFALTAPAQAHATQRATPRPPVTILISIDAFRPDYLRRGNTPVLDALASGGVEATMRPSFPTLTFPNHTTLVTGLRPDRHGIVANNMNDPRRPELHFASKALDATDPFWWSEHEPIWITAEKHGIRTGTMFWPGEEAAHDGLRAGDWLRFDPNFDGAARVRTIIDWMRRPAATRPRFVTLYLDAVDKAGHKAGPFGAATIGAVREVDTLIGQLRGELAALHQPANLVIVSDHGMRAVDPAGTIYVPDLLPREAYRLVGWGPFASIDAVPGHEAEVARALLAPHPRMACWRREDVPARYHYGANPRVTGFVCQAAAGAEVMDVPVTNKGDHGFDIDDPEMTGLFLVNGPAFRRTARIPAKFDNVDLYPLLARLIGVAPLPNDGDARTLAPLLARP